MKATRLIVALTILAAGGGAYAAGAADNAWLMQSPVGGQASAPAPASAAGNTSSVDTLNQAVEP